jgi:hypothetical protein
MPRRSHVLLAVIVAFAVEAAPTHAREASAAPGFAELLRTAAQQGDQLVDLPPATADNVTTWSCEVLSTVDMAVGVQWQQLNCSSKDIPFWGPMGPLVVNVVAADMTRPDLRLVPVAAQPVNGRSVVRHYRFAFLPSIVIARA